GTPPPDSSVEQFVPGYETNREALGNVSTEAARRREATWVTGARPQRLPETRDLAGWLRGTSGKGRHDTGDRCCSIWSGSAEARNRRLLQEPQIVSARFATRLLGWKDSPKNNGIPKNRLGWAYVPNCADVDSAESMRLAAGMLDSLEVERDTLSDVPQNPGGPLEQLVAEDLAISLPSLAPKRRWNVRRGQVISSFAQYEHLNEIDRLVDANPELRITIGKDYLIRPDVTIGLEDLSILGERPFLHAAISCKWTIRSDRVQNIRHEFNQMIRHRRGRQPHLVTVTAEPLPSRLASIARGTGEVDAVYHIALEALGAAVDADGNDEQVAAWNECIGQKRLLSYGDMVATLAAW
ncbi:MAG: hypothetical protein LC776_19915, partial [Acidobacteria bacterium]|nr:hypothetical protein [Acidobacteriota bacterium]